MYYTGLCIILHSSTSLLENPTRHLNTLTDAAIAETTKPGHSPTSFAENRR